MLRNVPVNVAKFLRTLFLKNTSGSFFWFLNESIGLKRVQVRSFSSVLTFPVPIPDEVRKLTQIFIFILPCGAWRGFKKAFKAFVKPFEAPQRTVKIKM